MRRIGGVRLVVAAVVAAAGCAGPAPTPSVVPVSPSPSVVPVSPAPSASPVSSAPSVASPAPLAPKLPAGTSCGVPPAYFAAATVPQTIVPSTRQVLPAWSAASGLPALRSMALSPDGAVIATAAADGHHSDIRLWDDAGRPLARLSGTTPQIAGQLLVACLAWSADGAMLASGSADGSVRLWSRSGKLVATFAGSDPIESLAWSAHGLLATGAIHFPPASATGQQPLPGVVRVWTPDGKLLHTLGTDFTGGKFLNLEWSRDGSMLAAGASDYAVWKADGSPVGTVRPDGTPAWAMDWAPDGSALAIGDENGLAAVVTTANASRDSRNFGAGADSLAYSPDGAFLAVGTRSTLVVVRADALQDSRWTVTVDEPQVRWSPDGRSLLVLGSGGLVVLSAEDGRALATLAGCEGNVTAFDRLGVLATAVTDAGRICRWDLAAAAL